VLLLLLLALALLCQSLQCSHHKLQGPLLLLLLQLLLLLLALLLCHSLQCSRH